MYEKAMLELVRDKDNGRNRWSIDYINISAVFCYFDYLWRGKRIVDPAIPAANVRLNETSVDPAVFFSMMLLS